MTSTARRDSRSSSGLLLLFSTLDVRQHAVAADGELHFDDVRPRPGSVPVRVDRPLHRLDVLGTTEVARRSRTPPSAAAALDDEPAERHLRRVGVSRPRRPDLDLLAGRRLLRRRLVSIGFGDRLRRRLGFASGAGAVISGASALAACSPASRVRRRFLDRRCAIAVMPPVSWPADAAERNHHRRASWRVATLVSQSRGHEHQRGNSTPVRPERQRTIRDRPSASRLRPMRMRADGFLHRYRRCTGCDSRPDLLRRPPDSACRSPS